MTKHSKNGFYEFANFPECEGRERALQTETAQLSFESRAPSPESRLSKMIRFENVSKRYASGQDALSDLSFELVAGEMAFVAGHSGAGKSTLLRLVALMDRPTRGRITVNGRDLTKVSARGVPAVRRGIGMVFQDHRLLMDRSAFDK